MTGIQMLLKQVGLDPEKVQVVFDQITTQLPAYLNAVGHKVESIDARLTALEYQQTATWVLVNHIADKLGIKPEVQPHDSTKQLTAANGSDSADYRGTH